MKKHQLNIGFDTRLFNKLQPLIGKKVTRNSWSPAMWELLSPTGNGHENTGIDLTGYANQFREVNLPPKVTNVDFISGGEFDSIYYLSNYKNTSRT